MRPSLPVRVVVSEDGGESVSISNVRDVDDAGVEMRLMDWSGWRDTTDLRANPLEIPDGDGTYDDEPLKSARTVTLKGVAYAPDVDTLVDRGDLMNRLLIGKRRRGQLAVQLLDRPWLACRGVRLGGATTWKETHSFPRPRAEWSMSLYAADATRYSLEVQSRTTGPYEPSSGFSLPLRLPINFGPIGSSGRVTVQNNGEIESPMTLLIEGACTNPQILQPETGVRYRLQTVMLDGQSILIDTGGRSVLKDGRSPWGWAATSDSDFPLAPPGISTLMFLTDAGSPSLTVTWADAHP